MTDTHTPGPWAATLEDDSHYARLKGYRIRSVNPVTIPPEYSAGGRTIEDMVIAEIFAAPYPVAVLEANARLIAAAPELLAVAEKLRDWLMADVEESHGDPASDVRVYHLDGGKLSVLLNDARVAIAEATGAGFFK